MPHPIDQPFPLPASPPLVHKPGAEAMKDYLTVFLQFRHERPGRTFASADISEFMRLAEHLDRVTNIEMSWILKELLDRRADLFSNEAQKARLRIFVRNHQERNEASKASELVKEILQMPPMPYFRRAEALELIVKAHELSAAIDAARAFYIEHGSDDPALVDTVNSVSDELAVFIDGFSLSDVDEPGKTARKARWRNIANFFRRLDGRVDHEAKWDEDAGMWTNWNRDIDVYPATYFTGGDKLTVNRLRGEIAGSDPVRIVAGGHGFNTSVDTGGRKGQGVGTLITLDRLVLSGDDRWQIVPENEAKQRYRLQDGKHVVSVSAGVRLRDFTEAMWAQGMALPVQGSTDAQSIGGLLASDLHSTGNRAGFLSQQTLEVAVLDHQGKKHTFRRNDSIAHGQHGRWVWRQPTGATRQLRKLPPAGAIGMTGVVVEATIQLVPAFNFEKNEQFVPRTWLEQSIERLLDPDQTDPFFKYDHVSMYYVGGFGANIRSVQLNTWKRTNRPQPANALKVKRKRELLDHIGSAFFPNTLFGLAKHTAPDPITGQGGNSTLRSLNDRPVQVLQANLAFARKLYFQHDEIEAGLPLPLKPNGKPDYQVFRDAIKVTQELLKDEELRTIIEVRFTPDVSEGMLGPGAGGPTCYVELATSMAMYSRERIVQVFQKFDKLMRNAFGGLPHLGKKTSVTAAEMASLYPADWTTFNEVRTAIDPGGKFRPEKNELLNRLFS